MRTVRSIRVRVAPEQRDEYVLATTELAAELRESALVKGFYVMENARQSGDFWEFWEFADDASLRAFAWDTHSPRRRAVLAGASEDISDWNQRV